MADSQSLLARTTARHRTERARKQKNAADGAERERIWQARLVSELQEIRPRWDDVWLRAGNAMREGNCHGAAKALGEAGHLLVKMQSVWTTWHQSVLRWQKSGVDSGFAHLACNAEPEWAFFWARDNLDKTVGTDSGPGTRPLAESAVSPEEKALIAEFKKWDGPIPTLRRMMGSMDVGPTIGDEAEGGNAALILLNGLVCEDGSEWRPTDEGEIAEFLEASGSLELFANLSRLLAGIVLPGPVGIDLDALTEDIPEGDRGTADRVLFAVQYAGLTVPRKGRTPNENPTLEKIEVQWDKLAHWLDSSRDLLLSFCFVRLYLEQLARLLVEAGLAPRVHALGHPEIGARGPAIALLQRVVRVAELYPSQLRVDPELKRLLDAVVPHNNADPLASPARWNLTHDIRSDVLRDGLPPSVIAPPIEDVIGEAEDPTEPPASAPANHVIASQVTDGMARSSQLASIGDERLNGHQTIALVPTPTGTSVTEAPPPGAAEPTLTSSLDPHPQTPERELRQFGGEIEAVMNVILIRIENPRVINPTPHFVDNIREHWRKAREHAETLGVCPPPDRPNVVTDADFERAMRLLADWARQQAAECTAVPNDASSGNPETTQPVTTVLPEEGSEEAVSAAEPLTQSARPRDSLNVRRPNRDVPKQVERALPSQIPPYLPAIPGSLPRPIPIHPSPPEPPAKDIETAALRLCDAMAGDEYGLGDKDGERVISVSIARSGPGIEPSPYNRQLIAAFHHATRWLVEANLVTYVEIFAPRGSTGSESNQQQTPLICLKATPELWRRYRERKIFAVATASGTKPLQSGEKKGSREGGRPKLGEGPNATDQQKAHRNVYELVRAVMQDGWGASALHKHFRDNRDFKEQVKYAGKVFDEKLFRAALAWINDPSNQET